jgi:hypothetical protein
MMKIGPGKFAGATDTDVFLLSNKNLSAGHANLWIKEIGEIIE